MAHFDSRRDAGDRRDGYVYDPVARPDLFDHVLSRRIVAFFIDAIIIVLLLIPAGLLVAMVGIVTLGIGWLLFPALFAIVAIAYVGLTLGGPASATVGMRMVGLQLRTWSGDRLSPVIAIMHALIFWFSVSLATPLVLVVGLFTYRKQLLQDLLLGLVMINSAALRDDEK